MEVEVYKKMNEKDPAQIYDEARKLIDSKKEADYDKALQTMFDLADKGYVRAQVFLMHGYENGWYVKKNLDKFFYYAEKAAENGDVSAQFELGNFYKYGKVVEKDLDKARYWYEQCAKQKDVMRGMFEPREAFAELGLMYMNGDSVEQNDKKAFECFNYAVGHSGAMYYVGKYYEEGKIVKKDLIKAYENYENSYNKGYKPAQKAMKRVEKEVKQGTPNL